MKKTVCLIVVACMMLAVMLMMGNSQIEYYSRKSSAMDYVTLKLTLDEDSVNEINDRYTGEDEYTLKQYYNDLVRNVALLPELCKYKENSDGSVEISMEFAQRYIDVSTGAEVYKVQRERGFFKILYTIETTNPLCTMKSNMIKYATSDASQISEDEKNTIAYILAAGNGHVKSLPKTFAYFENFDLPDIQVDYYFSAPKWNAATDNVVEKDGAEYLHWTEDDEVVTISYYVPNSLGWAITLGGVAIVVVVVFWLLSGLKKDKPDFADYREMKERYVMSLVEERIAASDEESNARVSNEEQPKPDDKNGYVGNGIFNEDGRKVDVFGNDVEQASHGSEMTTDGYEKKEEINPFE